MVHLFPSHLSLTMQQSVTVNQFILEHARVLRRSKTSQAKNTGNDVQVQQQAAIIYPAKTQQ